MQGTVESFAENRVRIGVDSPNSYKNEIKREPVPGVRELVERIGPPAKTGNNRERDGNYLLILPVLCRPGEVHGYHHLVVRLNPGQVKCVPVQGIFSQEKAMSSLEKCIMDNPRIEVLQSGMNDEILILN